MSQKIRIGIVGYGNIGKGVRTAMAQNPDVELIAVFTRRPVESLEIPAGEVEVVSVEKAADYRDRIDVMILCGGSATDLPEQGPYFAQLYNTVDSYDTHTKIPQYFAAVNEAALKAGKTSAISIGWDPGLFSLNRMLAEAILPVGREYTFWGPGVSQGHSDAIRRIPGVIKGIQYTIPREQVMEEIRKGQTPDLASREKHLRECYVVAAEGADQVKIAEQIKTMPDYFAEYDTEVFFISETEFREKHAAMPHGGFVMRRGITGQGAGHMVEFSLKLASNPEFTSSVLVAYARAVYRLNKEGQYGAKTVFDIPVGYLANKSPEELRQQLL